MTLPDERYRAIKMAEQLLRDLCDPKVTPRVDARIRDRARGALRHYPGHYDLAQLEAAAPHVVQHEMEPLHKMVLQYSNEDLRVSEDDASSELMRGYRE
jgi:hypothetical protein